MPVTKTAKRALRGSRNKQSVNKNIVSTLEVAIRAAKKGRTVAAITKAVSLTDRAAKKNVIHKNKAARLKSQLAKLFPQTQKATKTSSKKSPKK